MPDIKNLSIESNLYSSTLYWINHIDELPGYINNKCTRASAEIIVQEDQLVFFRKLTGEKEKTMEVVLLSLFKMIMKRFFIETSKGKFLSSSLKNPILFDVDFDFNINLKENLVKDRAQFLERINHDDYDISRISLDSYADCTFSFNTIPCGSAFDKLELNTLYVNQVLTLSVLFADGVIEKSLASSFLNYYYHAIVCLKELAEKTKPDYFFLLEKDIQLIEKVNLTNYSVSEEHNLIGIFEKQVDKIPDHVAVKYHGSQLTYSELNALCNQFCYFLGREFGVKHGDVVALDLPRSEQMVYSIFGILKSGASYLPIDHYLPVARKVVIIKDSGARLVIDAGVLTKFKAVVSEFSSENPLNKIVSDDLAYVIYTSGSTGKPKGVMIEHRGIVNRLCWMQSVYPLGVNDVLIQKTNYSFDVSVWEIFWWCLFGSSLYIPPAGIERDPELLVDEIEKESISVIHFVPSMFSVFLDYLKRNRDKIARLGSLKQVFASGEALPRHLAETFYSLFSDKELMNLYGPTEASIDVTFFDCRTQLDVGRLIPIGMPIWNTRIQLLNQDFYPVPVGVPGDLYIEGTGLARGYLNRTDLTAERFVQHPLTNERMYNSGDLARWLPDGQIEFLGRSDFQVKIRGHRIEPGEIENLLLGFENKIIQSAVEAKDIDGDKILVAYYVSKETGGEIDKAVLKSFLQQRLPEYMVPAYFIGLKSFPLTSSGKVDRKLLPGVSGEDVIKRAYAAPENETEQKLAGIWQTVLGVDKIGITDDFFDMGGHSLMIAQVINLVQQQLNKSLSYKNFFDGPTIAALAKLLQYSDYKSIPRAPVRKDYPLTASQHRLWILSQLEGGSIAYNMPAVVKLTGTVYKDRLEAAFKILIGRHEILRTYFEANKNGEVRQHILPEDACNFTVTEQEIASGPEAEEVLLACLQQNNRIAFNLEQPPLVRAGLIKVEESGYVFFLTMHHIVGDGWSTSLLVREVIEIYNALIQGVPNSLKELDIQYKDYSVWMQEQMTTEKYQQAKEFWVDEFKGVLPVLELPSFKKRPLIQTYNGNSISCTYPEEFLTALKTFSLEQGVTLFMTLMAGVKVLLNKYTGQQDIIIGTPIAGRNHPELENQAGLYLNTIAIRSQIEESDSFIEVLRKEKEILLNAYQHQQYPFDELISQLNIKRDISRSALFDVMLVLQNQSELKNLALEVQTVGFTVSDYKFASQTAQFDLSFNFAATDQLMLSIEYNTDIYDLPLIERIFPHLENLLTEAIKDPAGAVGYTGYLTASEKTRLISSFNDTDADYLQHQTVIDLFEEQVEKTPENIAVIFEEKEFSYRTLNQQASQLAWFLKESYAIQPDVLVGIKLDRSEQMIVAILAVLKAGGAYVPIDPDYPEERIAYIVKDSDCRVIIDQELLSEYFTSQHQYPTDNLEKNAMPESLAYVIYTSGTTGFPKGVMVENRNVVALFKATQSLFAFNQDDTWTMFHSYCFDFSVWEMYGALLYGGKLIVIPALTAKDSGTFLQVLKAHKVTVLNQTPSSFYNLVKYELESASHNLAIRYIIFGGEALIPAKLKDWYNLYGDTKLINMYGITETTVHVTYKEISEADINNNSSNIGRSLPSFTNYVLDGQMNLVPYGVTGELYIGGAGVSRGYLNKAALTAQRFIASPFNKNERLYRSGDLVKMAAEGELEYMGRIDAQVKIRGFRIELGEIEAALLHDSLGLKQSVADAREIDGEKVLVVYYVAGIPIEKTTIRTFLQDRLPGYMVPGFYVALASLPLTANGKIDRKSLPAVTAEDVIKRTFIAPSNNTELQLAILWQQVLGIEKIGITDNFFELGGHSLKATILISKIHETFNVKLPLRQVFISPTIESLSLAISDAPGSKYTALAVADQQEYYELSSAQKRLYFLQQFDLSGLNYNMPIVMSLDEGSADIHQIENAFRKLIQHHESLRTSFISKNNEIYQYIHDQVDFKIDCKEIEENELEAAIKTYIRPFDLAKDILIRVCLLKVAGKQQLLLVDMHHIISDGTTCLIIREDYFALMRGENPQPLKYQYKDFSEWQNRLIKSGQLAKQEKYWLDLYSGDIPKLELSTDFKRPEVFTGKGASYSFVLDKHVLSCLHAISKKHKGTLYMTLLGVLNTLLYKYTSQHDIIVGTGLAGRMHADVQRISGMFVNALAIRCKPAGDKTFSGLLDEVIENCLSAFENQDIQFEDLVDKLNLERDPSRNPLFDVCLMLQNFSDNPQSNVTSASGPVIGSNVNAQYLDVTTKFDITFFVQESAGKLHCTLEYYRDIFLPETIQGFATHFCKIIAAVITDTSLQLKNIDIIGDEERKKILFDFNDTQTPFPSEKTIHGIFEEQVSKFPDAVAVLFQSDSITYRQLDQRANQLANYLKQNTHTHSHSIVAVLMNKSIECMVAIMGILKSGGAYLPIAPDLPEERIKMLVDDASVAIVISEKQFVSLLNKIQWECITLKTYLCIDSHDIYHEPESQNSLMNIELWEYIGERGEDDITKGGWLSSYTGLPISSFEMNEYSDNVFNKLKPLLHQQMRVLEIGCASGLTMFRLAPYTGLYYGTDLSSVIIEENKEYVAKEGIANIKLSCLAAHEIASLDEDEFDLVIINSVIQNFHGYNYFRDVISQCVQKLKDTGRVFIGDVMDADKRQELVNEMVAFKKENAGNGYRTKTDWSAEFFVSRSFFEDLRADMNFVSGVICSDKIYTVANELTKFRYDALLEIDKHPVAEVLPVKHKYQHDYSVLASFSMDRPYIPVTPQDLCYVIYTSGTSGRPKAVLTEHTGIVNRLYWAQQYFQLHTGDKVLQKTTLSFDVSVWELFWPLLVGAKLVFASQEGHKDTDYLQSVIAEQAITTIHFVPSMLEVFLLSCDPQLCKGLKRVLCSGEALLSDQVALFKKKFPGVELHNLYGPTEAAIDVTCWTVPDQTDHLTNIPIGKPVYNTQLYILDKDGNIVPVGVAGELHIGGVQVARGYLNRDALNTEKFVEQSLADTGYSRMYKTGDLCRWLPDGNIEYSGRLDDQVKVRGYRIELDEIRNVIQQHGQVKQCAVIARQRADNEKEILAYYVSRPGISYQQKMIWRHKEIGIPEQSTLVELPNGLVMYTYNKSELLFLYDEIFKAKTYLKNGITIADGDCIFDVGANLGMFSVFSSLAAKNTTVYAFEPLPPTFNLLKLNTELYEGTFTVLPFGISNNEETVSFRHYQNATILSSRYMDEADVANTVREFIYNTENLEAGELSSEGIDQLLEERLISEKYDCTLKTLSQIIAEYNIQQIDLLKIDVEKAELDVLKGIEEKDWAKIKQLVLEVHDDSAGRLDYIKNLLHSHHYDVVVEESANMGNALIYDVFAISKRRSADPLVNSDPFTVELPEFVSGANLNESIRQYLKTQLPEYMIPAFLIELEELPLTSNGKLNRKALPEPEIDISENYVAASDTTEIKLLEIWASILKIDPKQISIHADFMTLGGHSLSATRVVTAMREQLQLTLNVKDFFLHPTIASMSAYLKNCGTGPVLPPVTAHQASKNIPLAFAQERLWFIDRLQGSVAYHMPSVFRLTGDVSIPILEASFKAIVERHQVLRTVLQEIDGEIYQEVKPAADWKMNCSDGLRQDDTQVSSYVHDTINKPFDLSVDYLMRVNLVEFPGQEYLVIIVMHHIVSDGWSMSVMVRELLELYHGFIHRKTAVLPPLPIQYSDYAIWQHLHLKGDAINKQLEYWKNQLRNVTPLYLTSDFSRPAVQSTNGATIYFDLASSLTEKLNDLSLKQGATLFMTTLAAFKVLLYKYTYQEDICIGVALANRTQSETESLIGFFVNALAIRSKVSKKMPFNEFLQQIKAVTLEGYANQDVPFEKVIEVVVGKRGAVGNPLIQVMFVLQNTPEIPAIELGNIKLTPEPFENITSKFDLTWDLQETKEGIRIRIEYCTDLFRQDTIQRMISHYENILTSIVEDPSVPMRLLNMMSADEEQQLIYGFNDTVK